MVGCGAESWWVFHTAYSRVDPLPDEVLPNVADSTGDCVFIPSRWYHYVDSSRTHAEIPELNMGLNVWWPRVDLLDEATVDDENQDAGTSAPAHLTCRRREFPCFDVHKLYVRRRMFEVVATDSGWCLRVHRVLARPSCGSRRRGGGGAQPAGLFADPLHRSGANARG
jgi:hypothetical protein